MCGRYNADETKDLKVSKMWPLPRTDMEIKNSNSHRFANSGNHAKNVHLSIATMNRRKHMSTKHTNFLFECVQELNPDIHSQGIKCLRL